MNRENGGFTLADLAGLPPSLSLEAAALLLGVGRTNAYALARARRFPVPVIRIGKLYRVPTAPVLRLLGVAAPDGLSRRHPNGRDFTGASGCGLKSRTESSVDTPDPLTVRRSPCDGHGFRRTVLPSPRTARTPAP